jgi:outer membrane cobalamin receptor
MRVHVERRRGRTAAGAGAARRVRGWIVVAALVALAAGSPVGAQEEKTLTKKVDPVVVTATTVATPAEQLGVSLNVVTEDDFKTYHYSTVDEALRSVPGVEIRRSGSLGKTSSISIRGANSNQVQLLVDGVRVKSPTLGQVDLSDISPDLIERIEIIRGPQSTLYGADAIGGVVNIITKKGTGLFRPRCSRRSAITTPSSRACRRAAPGRSSTIRSRPRISRAMGSSRTTARMSTR